MIVPLAPLIKSSSDDGRSSTGSSRGLSWTALARVSDFFFFLTAERAGWKGGRPAAKSVWGCDVGFGKVDESDGTPRHELSLAWLCCRGDAVVVVVVVVGRVVRVSLGEYELRR